MAKKRSWILVCGCSLRGLRALLQILEGQERQMILRKTVAKIVESLGWKEALELFAKIPSPQDAGLREALAMYILVHAMTTSQAIGLVKAYSLNESQRLSTGYCLALDVAESAIGAAKTDRDRSGLSHLHKQASLTRIALAALTFAKHGFFQGPKCVRDSKAYHRRLFRLMGDLVTMVRPLVAHAERDRAQRNDGFWRHLSKGVELLPMSIPDPLTSPKAKTPHGKNSGSSDPRLLLN